MESNREKDSSLLSIVIPVYCEERGLTRMITEVCRLASKVKMRYEIIIVDDGSNDRTWEVIGGVIMHNEFCKGIQLSRNFGKEAALSAGLDNALGDVVVVMDGDLQHPPEIVVEMIQMWRVHDFDIVDAVKDSRGKESWLSRCFANLFYRIFFVFTKCDLRGASDFKLLDRRALNAWKEMPERSLFFRGMSSWTGFKRGEIRFQVGERLDGVSGWDTFKLIRLAISAITSFSSAPLHIISGLGIAFAVLSVVVAVNTLYQKIFGSAETGFATVIILLLIIGSVLMIALGIIGEYIARIYDEVKGRPRYIISKSLPD